MTKGAIFDMDGTLVDTERLYRIGWLYAAEAVGEIPHPDFPEAMCSVGGEVADRNVKKFYPNRSFNELLPLCLKRFMELLQTELQLMPGVREILTYLKENGYKIGIATGSGRAVIDHNIQKCGIAEFFDTSIGGDEVENGKPFPDIYLLAAEKMNVPIEQCYIFEDSDNGVLGAVRSGGKTIMVTNLGEPNDFAKEHCIGTFKDMHEALAAIKNGSLKK